MSSDTFNFTTPQNPVKRYILHEEWRILEMIHEGRPITESDTPNMGMPKSFTIGRGRTNWNSDILDNFAAYGFLDRATNKITANGILALAMHDAALLIGGER